MSSVLEMLIFVQNVIRVRFSAAYLNEPLKARVIDELRPKTKVPNEKSNGKPSKKVLAKRAEDKAKNKEKAKVKVRHRDAKNVGKRRQAKAKPAGDAE